LPRARNPPAPPALPGSAMTEPLEKIRVGMTGRKEVVVTRELTVGGHVEGMPFVYGTPMTILAMGRSPRARR
jgi:hypothetical protein